MNPFGRFVFLLLILVVKIINSTSDQASLRASEWLLSKRNQDLHWGPANALALMALSHSPNWDAKNLESRIAVKQLDIDFLYDRIRHGDIEVYSSRLIPLVFALTSLCRDPADFYGYDLLDGLVDQSEGDFSFASEVLAVCGGQGLLRRSHIRRLLRLLSHPKLHGPSADIDTTAMIVMAAGCVANNYGYNQAILPAVDKLVKGLSDKQRPDGSFHSNIVSTSLAIQAMQVTGLSANVNSTRQAAIGWLISVQSKDGSFLSDLLSTTEALLALSPRGGRAHIHLSRCQSPEPPRSDFAQTEQIIFKILIWVGQPVVQQQSHILRIPVNGTLYEAMERAKQEGLIQFKSTEFPFGHYISAINNISEKDYGRPQRWMVYSLPDSFDNQEPQKEFLIKTGVSSHRPREGERILFWYRPAEL